MPHFVQGTHVHLKRSHKMLIKFDNFRSEVAKSSGIIPENQPIVKCDINNTTLNLGFAIECLEKVIDIKFKKNPP